MKNNIHNSAVRCWNTRYMCSYHFRGISFTTDCLSNRFGSYRCILNSYFRSVHWVGGI